MTLEATRTDEQLSPTTEVTSAQTLTAPSLDTTLSDLSVEEYIFKNSAAFKTDPDLARIERWYHNQDVRIHYWDISLGTPYGREIDQAALAFKASSPKLASVDNSDWDQSVRPRIEALGLKPTKVTNLEIPDRKMSVAREHVLLTQKVIPMHELLAKINGVATRRVKANLPNKATSVDINMEVCLANYEFFTVSERLRGSLTPVFGWERSLALAATLSRNRIEMFKARAIYAAAGDFATAAKYGQVDALFDEGIYPFGGIKDRKGNLSTFILLSAPAVS